MKKGVLVIFLIIYIVSPLKAQLSIQEKIDELLTDQIFETSEIGISIYDLTDNKPIYNYREKKLMRPASVLKLITAVTALQQSDGDKPFLTEVYSTGTIVNDTLFGDIFIKGGFDPEFNENGMDHLVATIADLSFSELRGNLWGDITMKDSLYWGPGWSWDDTPYYFQPYLSPLMLNKGYVNLTIEPTEPGISPRITAKPESSFYSIDNQAISKKPSAGKLGITRNWLENRNDIIVRGNCNTKFNGRINIYKSEDFFMHVLTEKLNKKGINTTTYGYRKLPADSTLNRIGSWETPVREVLAQALKKSDNLSAEALFYRMGALNKDKEKTSAENGSEMINEFMKTLGHNPDNYKIADGSGISLYNYITPELLMDYLKYAYSQTDLFRYIYIALPISGIDGTLQNRMKNTQAYKKVTAKTGSVTGVNSLAGYLKTVNNHDVAFVIIHNNVLDSKKSRNIQDKICEILCESSPTDQN